jgi:hypothetical protein
MSWQEAFLAVSTLLGEPHEIAAASLDDDPPGGRDSDLTSPSRPVRAAAAARAAILLVAELGRARFA